jgi:hypothetical protein
MNHAWSRSRSSILCATYFSPFSENTCAVPVLPPDVYSAPANARALVPSLFTPTNALRTSAMCSGFAAIRCVGCGATARSSPVFRLTMFLTRCGRNATPSLATIAVACASCMGVNAL